MIPLGLVFGATVGFVHLPLTLRRAERTHSVVTVIMMVDGFLEIEASSRDNNELLRYTG